MWPSAVCAFVCMPGRPRVSFKTNTTDELHKHVSWPQISSRNNIWICRTMPAQRLRSCVYTQSGVHHDRVIILKTQLSATRNTLQQEHSSLLVLDLLLNFSVLSTYSNCCCSFFWWDTCCNMCMSAQTALLHNGKCTEAHLWWLVLRQE